MIAISTKPDSRAGATERDSRWAAVLARDARFDERFVFAVRSTGVYCRPSCTSRRARPENVTFFDRPAEAETAGYRACRRCRPDTPAGAGRHATAITAACRRLEDSAEPPRLETLAKAAGMSPFHFHRVFKAATGLTPRGYFDGFRSRRMRARLGEGATSVTEAIYDAGYGSSSRFYERSDSMLGMTPTRFRAGGAGADVRFAVGRSMLGAILVACSAKGVCAIALGDDPDGLVRDLQDRFSAAKLIGDDPEFQALVARVVGFVETPALGLDLPLDVQGTAFQQRVWQALRDIPVGETRSYTDVAQRIGAPAAVRAVAQACAANTLAIAIPCHRVVRRDGDLSGYRWGVERKRALLAAEAGQAKL